MGFEVPDEDSPLATTVGHGADEAPLHQTQQTERAARPDGSEHHVDVEDGALGELLHGDLRDALSNTTYDDGRPFPQFGDFPPDQPPPLPAPALPSTRMKPRG